MRMKLIKHQMFAALFGAAALMTAHGQGFDNGSNGSLGALTLTDSDVTIDLPPDGRLNYTTVTIPSGRFLNFRRNALNTPVILLAQGDVVIDGVIDVSGSQAPGSPPIGGFGGPGGFDGGKPGFGDDTPPGDGYGPGAGGAGQESGDVTGAGSGTYSSVSGSGSSTSKGGTYGSPLLIPLIGGSGGGGTFGSPGNGGGGGGGAILISSNTKIRISGNARVDANGGGNRGSSLNAGSGGAIRLLAPRVEGTGALRAFGGGGGGDGRIRVDCLDKTGLQFSFQSSTTVGANMFVQPPALPRLDFIDAAGQAIALDIANPVHVQLPFGSSSARTLTLRAKDFGADTPIRVTLTPDAGPRIVIDTNIVNTAAANPATLTIPVSVPANTLVTINAWTR